MTAEIAANVAYVRERIAQAAQRAGRSADDITLIAVSKTMPQDRILAAYAAGVRHYGENYVQEALTKLASPELDLPGLVWHFIGHLQSNKVRDVVGRFSLIHSVDSLALARAVARRAARFGSGDDAAPDAAARPETKAQLEAEARPETEAAILLEVKLDPATTKFGFDPAEIPRVVDEVMQLRGVQLRGLMGMAPYGADPEQARPYLRRLHALFRQLPPAAQQTLSMGMTGDFEVAIEEGATHVRIGTAIFGKRRTTAEESKSNLMGQV